MKKNKIKKPNNTKRNKINPIKSILNLIKRYNLVIFIVILAGGLTFAIIALTEMLNGPTVIITQSTVVSDTVDIITFDQTTINRINNLKTAEENSGEQVLPSGRLNPFSE